MKLGKAIELRPTHFDRSRNRVYLVGVELEGGWEKMLKGCEIHRDTSVRFSPTPNLNYVGEIESKPLELSEMPKWVKQYYPHHINDSCGMHIHLSFRTALTYSRLMAPSYPATIVKYMHEWAKREGLPPSHSLWSRLRGESEYCQHTYWAEDQVFQAGKEYDRKRKGHRYTVINYCFTRHSTLECRLLPMMANAEQAIRALQEVIRITNAYLVATAKRDTKSTGTAELDTSETREVHQVEIPTRVERRVYS